MKDEENIEAEKSSSSKYRIRIDFIDKVIEAKVVKKVEKESPEAGGSL